VLRSLKYGINGAVIAGLIAVPVLWSTVDKSVKLVVDGQARTVQTTAGDVGQVLSANGLRVSAHDLVAPRAAAAVHDGTTIVLRRGRLLNLSIDGRPAQVWTTARTVDEALAELGYTSGDFVSVSRSRRLPLGSTNIAIRTPRLVSIVHDGSHEQVTTTDATVGDVLDDLGIAVGKDDRLSVAASSAVVPNEVVTLQRVRTQLLTRTETVHYRVVKHDDSALFKGVTRVLHAGRDGKARVTYALVYVDGKLAGRTTVHSTTLTAAQARVLGLGTKQLITVPSAAHSSSGSGGSGSSGGSGGSVPSAPVPSPGTAKAIAKQLLAARGWGGDQYSCLVILWNHESGWRVHADNSGSGAYGIPQALPGSKMASAGPDWRDSAQTQITWGLRYIAARYSTPCGAWATWQAHGGWY
jgi:resuscitation-promoting factor RpfB